MKSLLKNWRQILLIGSLLLFAYLIYQQHAELIKVGSILRHGSWGWFILALAMQMLFYSLQAAMYRRIIEIWIPVGFAEIFRLTLASNSLNKILPSGGMSGLALFIAQARESGVGTGLSLITNAMFYSLDYLSFLIIVWWGLFFYGPTIGLGEKAVWAITIFTAVIIAASLLLVAALQNEARPRQWLDFLNRRIPRLRAKTADLYEALDLLGKKRRNLFWGVWWSFIYAFLMQLTDVGILYLCFEAVKYPLKLGAVVAGFGLSSVTALISMVPQGIGIYETAMTWIYNHMGVPFSIAITVALIYRGITFWFAIIPGLFTMQGRKRKINV